MISLDSYTYVCDTIPAAKLAALVAADPDLQLKLLPRQQADSETTMAFEPAVVLHLDGSESEVGTAAAKAQQPPQRKLCVRHQRMADQGMNVKLQMSLDSLPLEERESINTIWSSFSSSSHPRRALILQGLLTMCCFSQLSLISEQLAHLIRIDPFNVLPREICLKILGYLDATSLCRAAQVTKKWKALADDNVLWKGICEQHIGQKCAKCGWGLPILEKKRCAYRPKSSSPGPSSLPAAAPSLYAPGSPGPSSRHRAPTPSSALKMTATLPTCSKRGADPCSIALTPPLKRYRSDETNSNSTSPDSSPSPVRSHSPPRSGTVARTSDDDDAVFSESSVSSTTIPIPPSVRKPWKVVFGERMTVERNWRRGRCTTRTLTGHTDGVMCLQFSENLPHPSFPVLISGSYDRTVRVWNMETGTQLHCLRGHTFAVRALQFDEAKLITGSMDCTLKVWDWRAGKCIRTLTGHSEGVVCLHYDENVLASGSVDSTIKVWNLRTGGSFTLRGHSDWVNSVQLWDPNPSTTNERASSEGPPLFESSGSRSPSHNCCYQIDPGKMLFSASDDGTIRLWDLNARTCVRQFLGHMGQVQSMKLLLAGEHDGDDSDEEEEREREKTPSSPPDAPHHTYPFPYTYLPQYHQMQQQHLQQEPQRQLAAKNLLVPKRKKPVLVSGSLDNTIKLWDIETGQAIRTYFGHIEGVWAVASDKMRLVSGSHDRTIKVWSRDSEKCLATLIEHQAAVTCLALGEDKVVSGSDDCTIKIWSFDD